MQENASSNTFNKAVVAAAFSPRLVNVLNESCRFLKILGAWPIIVHVGEDTPAVRVKIEEAVERSDFREHPPIFLVRSGQTADVLIQAAREYNADLIVAGALKKEGLFKYVVGSVARRIARQANCSVLLLTDPQIKPQAIEKIHCIIEYDEESQLAIFIAAAISDSDGVRDVYMTHSFRMLQWEEKKSFPNNAEEIKSVYNSEDKKLKEYLEQFGPLEFVYHTQSLYESSKHSTINFTRHLRANLLIVPSPIGRLGFWDRLFPHEVELALQDLPCSLLLVRKTNWNI